MMGYKIKNMIEIRFIYDDAAALITTWRNVSIIPRIGEKIMFHEDTQLIFKVKDVVWHITDNGTWVTVHMYNM